MHVALVSPHAVWPVHGADTLRTSQLARELRELGVDVTVLALSWFPDDVKVAGSVLVPGRPASAPAKALRRLELAIRERSDPWAGHRLPGARRRMAAAIVDTRPDVVDFQHTFMWQSTAAPSVLTLHNVESDRLRRFGALPARTVHTVTEMERAAIRNATAAVVFSEEDAVRTRALHDRLVHVVPIGVDPGARLPAPRDTVTTAAYVGTFNYPPNAQAAALLLEEWPRIKAAGRLDRLVFVGRNADAFITASADVEVRSDVPDVPAALADADVLLVPLVSGGGVRVKIIEAFALGLPVVSTALGIEGLGARDGVHAIIVDRPDEMAGAIARLQPVGLRRVLADNARRLWEEQFSPRQMAEQMLEVYADAAALAARPA
ncbi:MAG: glycosyltransferase family 4 protein [Mycobacteriales bacterium]